MSHVLFQLEFVTAWELGLAENLCLDDCRSSTATRTVSGYEATIAIYKQLCEKLSPFEKLTHVCRIAKSICLCVDLKRDKRKIGVCVDAPNHAVIFPIQELHETGGWDTIASIGADDLLLLFVLICVRGSIPHLYAEVRFMEAFLTDICRATSEGYYHATLQAATELLRTIEKEKIIHMREHYCARDC